MKYLLTKEEYEALSDEQKALYKVNPKDDKQFVLSVEGMPEIEDVEGLKTKNKQLLDEKKKLEQEKQQEIDAAVEAALKEAQKSGDAEALGKSWEQKFNNKVAEMQAIIDSKDSTISNLTSGSEALRIATELAVDGSSDALLPHVQRRLKTEMVDGEPVVKVLGIDGKISAMKTEELVEELKGNKALAPLLKGTKGQGSGITPSKETPKIGSEDFSKLSPQDRLTAARAAQSEK